MNQRMTEEAQDPAQAEMKAAAGEVPLLSRRQWALLAGVGVASAAAGGGWAWWRGRPTAAEQDAGSAFWDRSFETPVGETLSIQSLRGNPLLVNFWATWCPPCIAELPLLDGFYRENASKNWKVLGIAVDQLASVKGFLERSPVTFPVAMAGQGGIELARSLGNLHGGLPFSVLFGADGRILHRKMGQVTDGDLRAWQRLG